MPQPRFTIGDAIIDQFVQDCEELAFELNMLESRKRQASSGAKDVALMNRINKRVERLVKTFDERRSIFDRFFGGAWADTPEVRRLRAAMASIAPKFDTILQMGEPDFGDDSLAGQVKDFLDLKSSIEESSTHHMTTAKHKTIIVKDAPLYIHRDIPPDITGGVMVALALFIDVIGRIVKKRQERQHSAPS